MGGILRLNGEVARAEQFTACDLNLWPEECQVRSVEQVIPGRSGDAIRLSAFLERCPPLASATHLTLHSSTDAFAASLPLERVRDVGMILYQQAGKPLTKAQGGPFRFLVENSAPCKTDELDACANVKFLDRIELSAGPGKDTR